MSIAGSSSGQTGRRRDRHGRQLVLATERDEMRATLDGKPLRSHRSEGFAHSMERWFGFLMALSAWIGGVEVCTLK